MQYDSDQKTIGPATWPIDPSRALQEEAQIMRAKVLIGTPWQKLAIIAKMTHSASDLGGFELAASALASVSGIFPPSRENQSPFDNPELALGDFVEGIRELLSELPQFEALRAKAE